MPLMPEMPGTEPGFAETVAQLFPTRQHTESAPPEHDGAASRRRKLWEIEAEHHCIVIGTCISMPELRRFSRQAGIVEWSTATDYELHRIAVTAARERGALSKLMHKGLERKFPLAVRRLEDSRNDEELRAAWKETLGRGELAGPLWALMTHPMTSAHTLVRATEELHMLSHQVGAASRADLQRLVQLEQENRALKEQLQRLGGRASAQLAEKDVLIHTLEARAAEAAAARARCEHVEARLREFEGSAAISDLRQRAHEQARRAERAEARASELSEAAARCERLERALSDARHEARSAQSLLAALRAEDARPMEPCPRASCPAELAGRCVLCVGGRAGLVEQYRVLVEHCRGEFAYHDGGLENSMARLQAFLASADAVICLTGNVSHGAYYVVKRHCKQHGKPCVLLKNGALSSFCQGLSTLAGGATPGGGGTQAVLLGSPVPPAKPQPAAP